MFHLILAYPLPPSTKQWLHLIIHFDRCWKKVRQDGSDQMETIRFELDDNLDDKKTQKVVIIVRDKLEENHQKNGG